MNEQRFGNLELWANYSFLDAEFENTLTGTTMEAPFTSEHKVKLGGTITVNDAFFSVNAHWIGETAVDTPQIDPSVPAENSAGSYFVINANLGVVDIVDGLDIALRVENLLDERYFNAGTGVNITFVESPQNPRQVWLRLDYAF